jgi:hypothetical protein
MFISEVSRIFGQSDSMTLRGNGILRAIGILENGQRTEYIG